MGYDYNELRGKIRGKFGTQEAFAQALGINPASLSAKLNNKSDWSHVEIACACELLNISLEEASVYFFTPLVEKTQQVPT